MRGKWEIWIRRPVLWFLLVYLVGLVISMYLPVSSMVLFLTIIIFAVIGILLHRKALLLQSALFPLLLILIFLLGGMRGNMHHEKENPLTAFVNSEISMQGLILGAPQVEDDRVIYIIQTTAVKIKDDVFPIQAKVKVSVYPDANGSVAIVNIQS